MFYLLGIVTVPTISFHQLLLCVMASMKHMWFLLCEDILENLEGTDLNVSFRNSISESKY